jgi:uncharacterized membrane protein HdeD (DUF308 family)
MRQYFLEDDIKNQFKTHSMIAGILLLIAGLIGIFLPELTSLTISFIIGWLLVIGGLISGYHVMKSYNSKLIAWLKPFVLASMGLLILNNPITGVAAIGLLLIIYFLFDGFAGIMLGLEFRSLKGWVWMLFNGLISIIIALIFLIGWPLDSIWLVGLFVGISLLLDGTAMIIIGTSIHKNIFD